MDRRYLSKAAEKRLLETARRCIPERGERRPEAEWLAGRFEALREKYHLGNRTQTDRAVYERMYGHAPEKPADCLKIRYWRTGRGTPANREQCDSLADALELIEDERKFLFRGYYDRSDTYYPDKAGAECSRTDRSGRERTLSSGRDDFAYEERCRCMKELIRSYLERIPDEVMRELRIDPEEREHYFRHLYFTDAFHYVWLAQLPNPAVLRKHITSTRYDSELRRQTRLLGEIPRRVMLRHLLILNAPELSADRISSQLEYFGYLPLTEGHTLTGGEYLDRIVIRLLEEYEHVRDPEYPREGRLWFQEACRVLDRYFAEQGKPRLRFMYFKALE